MPLTSEGETTMQYDEVNSMARNAGFRIEAAHFNGYRLINNATNIEGEWKESLADIVAELEQLDN